MPFASGPMKIPSVLQLRHCGLKLALLPHASSQFTECSVPGQPQTWPQPPGAAAQLLQSSGQECVPPCRQESPALLLGSRQWLEESRSKPPAVLPLRRSSTGSCHLCPGGGGSGRLSLLGFLAWVPVPFSFTGYKSPSLPPCDAGPWAACTEPPCFCPYSALPCTQLLRPVGEE